MSRRATVALLAALAVLADGCGAPRHDHEPERATPPRPALVGVALPVLTHRFPARAHRGRVGAPVRVEIPAIGVRAPVIRLGLERDGTLGVPRRFGDTGWWSGGPRPGERGPAVIAGHVDSYTGPAVFYRLRALRRGDVIRVVRRDGSATRFAVQHSEHHSKARFPTARVYGSTRSPALRLVTCGGAFDRSSGHYLENTIVFATVAAGS